MTPHCYNHSTPVAMVEYVGFTERGGYFCKECELPAKAPVEDPIDENAPVFYVSMPEFDSAWLGPEVKR